MSAEKTVTEREAVMREREAAESVLGYFRVFLATADGLDQRRQFVANRHPLPKVERQRVVTVSDDVQMRLDAEFYLEERWSGRDWTRITLYAYSDPKTRQALAELLASPTELVEDDVSLLRDGGL